MCHRKYELSWLLETEDSNNGQKPAMVHIIWAFSFFPLQSQHSLWKDLRLVFRTVYLLKYTGASQKPFLVFFLSFFFPSYGKLIFYGSHFGASYKGLTQKAWKSLQQSWLKQIQTLTCAYVTGVSISGTGEVYHLWTHKVLVKPEIVAKRQIWGILAQFSSSHWDNIYNHSGPPVALSGTFFFFLLGNITC